MTGEQKHVEADQFRNSPAAENPVSDSFNIIVSVPENIQIRMVDASALEDYEVWLFMASLLSNAAVGFVVAYFQAVDISSPSAPYVGWTSALFVVLCGVFFTVAVRKRSALRRKSKDVRLKTVGASLAK